MIRNIKKLEIKHCKYCGAKFPEGSLNDFVDDINVIVCESCGTENKIESFEIQDDKKKERNSVKKGKSDKNRTDSSSKKEFNRQIRLQVFRTIYEMLKDPEYNFDIKENQNELTEFQLNRLVFALRKKVLEIEIPEEWLNDLNVIKRLDFKEYYENLQLILSTKRKFKESFQSDFQKAIEFAFELLKGKIIISELETEKGQEYTFIKNKKEIAEDLIKKFGFLEDMKLRGNFEIFLKVFISRYIYDTIKDSKFESVMGAYKGELTPSQIDKLALSLKTVFSCQYIKDEWFENFSRHRKRSFLKNYQRLQTNILKDHLYSVSFLDYLKYLIRLVDGLINGKNVDSELKKNELIIARDLRSGDPFQSIGTFNPLFKPNLLIVLGRIAYLIAKTMESDRESNEDQANRLEIDTEKILNKIIPEIATKNKINDELLKKLYKISKEDFQKDYAKLKSNLKSDQICYSQVSFYLKWVIETVLNILSRTKPPSKFSIIEKTIVRDLKDYSFDNLIDGQKEGADSKTVNLLSNSKNISENEDDNSDKKEEIDEDIFENKRDEEKFIFVEKVQVPYSKELSKICHLSKNLYNLGNWLIRMRYFFLLKPSIGLPLDKIYANLWKSETKKEINFSISDFLLKFKRATDNYINKINQPFGRQGYHSIDPDEIMERFDIDKESVIPCFKNQKEFENYYRIGVLMNYDEIWRLVHYSPEYLAFCGQKGQQTLKLLVNDWKSFFELKKLWKKNPKTIKPNIPNYKKKNGEVVVIFPNQSIYKVGEAIRKRKKNGKCKTLTIIGFSPKKLNLPTFKTTIPFELIRQVRIVPKGNIYIIEVVYKNEMKNINKDSNIKLDKNRIVGVDLGVNNLLTIANNIGDRPRIVKGGVVKSANFLVERRISKLVFERDNLINSIIKLRKEDRIFYKDDIEKFENKIKELDKQIAPAWNRRNNRVSDVDHKASRLLIDYCISNQIGTLIIGYNEGWKQTIKMRKKERKRFHTIPFRKLVNMIKYKADLEGIEVIKVKEFKDDEKGKRKGSSHTCCCCGEKGNRVYRGLFKCPYCGVALHADVNGAYNHLKWGKENSLIKYTKRSFERVPIPLTRSNAQA